MTVGANTSLRMRKVRFRDPAGSVRVGEWIDDAVEFGSQRFELEDIDLLPADGPSKIVCVGLNYANHAAETDSDIPDRPLLFLKTPNTLAGAEDTITLPESKDRIDFEGELGSSSANSAETWPRKTPSRLSRATPASTTSRIETTSGSNRTGYVASRSTTPRRSDPCSRRRNTFRTARGSKLDRTER